MSIKVKIYNQQAEAVGEMELSENVFGLKANEALIHQAAVTQMANERPVIAHTKDRSEVRGGGRKPWRQKGTGRARHGSSRSPIWIGGGVTFGPRNERNFKKKINKKMKKNALLMVLSARLAGDNFIILDKLAMTEFKTKIFKAIINSFASKILKTENVKPNFLFIIDGSDEKLSYSARNLAGIKLINIDNINIIDLLKYKNLVMTKGVVGRLEERYK